MIYATCTWLFLSFITYYLIQYFNRKASNNVSIKIFDKEHYWGLEYNDIMVGCVLFSPVFILMLIILTIDYSMRNLITFFINK